MMDEIDISDVSIDISKYVLGETDEEFVCIDEEDNQKIAIAMVQQTELHLDILSRDLDPDVYDNHEFCDVLEDLALRSRYSKIRILLHNTKLVSQRGHLVMHLGRRLGSLMQIRQLAEVHKSTLDTFMIADGIGIMHRPHSDTLAATVNFKDRPKIKELSKLFDKLWLNAELDQESRFLVI